MFAKKEDYKAALELFVEKYLIYRECTEDTTIISDKELTRVINEYFSASGDLCKFVEETYNEEDPELPDMEAYYSVDGYNDFSYRIYSGVYSAKQLPPEEEWRIFGLVYIGELLRKKYKGINN